MNTLIQVAHDLKSNTLEATWLDDAGNRGCQNFSPLQIEDFKLVAGEHAQRYINLSGWTPEYIASVKVAEEVEAKAKQDKADAEDAEARAKADKDAKDAFNAEVTRQVEIAKAVQAALIKE